MENLGKYISTAIAVSFICTVAFLIGEAGFGLNEPRLLPYFTFTDFVDSAPVTVGSLLLYIGWSLWNDERHRIAKNYVRAPMEIPPKASLILLFGWAAAMAVLSYFTAWQIAFVIFILGCVAFQLWCRILPTFRKPENEALINWIERGSYVVFLAFLTGIFWGHSKLLGDYTVITEKQTYTSSKVMQLSRGVAILNDHGFVLVPWDQIKSLAYADESAPKPAAKALAAKAPSPATPQGTSKPPLPLPVPIPSQKK